MPERLERVRCLADESEVNRSEAWTTRQYKDMAFVSFGDDPVFTYPLPDEADTVLEITLKWHIGIKTFENERRKP